STFYFLLSAFGSFTLRHHAGTPPARSRPRRRYALTTWMARKRVTQSCSTFYFLLSTFCIRKFHTPAPRRHPAGPITTPPTLRSYDVDGPKTGHPVLLYFLLSTFYFLHSEVSHSGTTPAPRW